MSDSTTPQGDAAMSPASTGSVSEPAAWGILRVGGSWRAILCEEAQAEHIRQHWEKSENWVHELVPLYRSPMLTDAEREAVWALASHHLDDATFGKFAKTLSGLFERTNVTEYPRSKLLPTVMPDQLDAVIEGLERIKALEAEIARLRAAARAVLDGVNKRYPDKNPREWTCPHMAELDRLVPPNGSK